MRNKLLALLLSIGLLFPMLTVGAAAQSYTIAEVESLYDGIVAFQEARCGASSAQEWLDTGLRDSAGISAEFYAITLSRSGDYDFTAYRKALLEYIAGHEVYSPVTREKYALALAAAGSSDSYIQQVCDADIGGMGLMSLVFGLHLLNNGYTSALYTSDSLISAILDCQLADGGWAVIGSAGDVDVTAMTIQALAPHYGSSSSVASAIDSALELLSEMQLESGGFVSMGSENCESSAQVLTALSSLDIDQSADERFIKNGSTVLDAMLRYRCSDGSFAHISDSNENATIQACYALCAYLRTLRGQSPYYIFDKTNDAQPQPEPAQTEPTGSAANNTAKIQTASPSTEPPTSSSTKVYPTEPYHGEYIAPTGDRVFQPTGTAPAATHDEAGLSAGGYKLWAILAALAIALIVCLIMLLLGKSNIKNYIAAIGITAVVVIIILLTNFESVESYRQVEDKTSAVGTVTLSIRCDTIADEDDRPLTVPEDGAILDNAEFTISEGETVYDILLEASKTYGIQIDNRGADGVAYIAGIEYLYEFDYGSMSGWMYRVNGETPEVGCQGYVLSDGDRIEWLYTRDIGKDL